MYQTSREKRTKVHVVFVKKRTKPHVDKNQKWLKIENVPKFTCPKWKNVPNLTWIMVNFTEKWKKYTEKSKSVPNFTCIKIRKNHFWYKPYQTSRSGKAKAYQSSRGVKI